MFEKYCGIRNNCFSLRVLSSNIIQGTRKLFWYSILVRVTRVSHVIVKNTVKSRKNIISGVGSLAPVQNELLWENQRVHGRCWLKWSIISPFQMLVSPCLSIICLFFRYRAPECLLTDGYYTHKMDMWSVGCVFFEVLRWLELKQIFLLTID